MKTSTTSSWEPPVLLASDRHDCAALSESMTMSATEPTPPPQPHEAAEQNLLPFPCTFVRCSFGGSGQVWSGPGYRPITMHRQTCRVPHHYHLPPISCSTEVAA